MKVLTTISAFSLVILFTIACSDSTGKKMAVVDEKVSAATKNDSPAKKETPATQKSTPKKWIADAANAKVQFSVKGPFGTVHGDLKGLKSTILFDENDLASSSFNASVETKTISTGIGLRNHDIQKDKYLDEANHPFMSFRSTKIERSGKAFKAIGQLTIKGVSKQVEIPFSFTEKGNAGVFKGSFSINREDYGIGKSGGSIGDTISIDLEVPVTR